MASYCLRLKTFLGICVLLFLLAFVAETQTSTNNISTTNHPNILNLLGPDGRLTEAAYHFTTKAYDREALRLVIEEANKVAMELQLPEQLPIAETNLTGAFILGYGMSYLPPGMIGNVHTRDYGYFVSVGHKLSFVEGTHQYQDCLKWSQHYQWPLSRIDTNQAYQLATQWMVAASMDDKALNRDCEVHIELDPLANDSIGKSKKNVFIPVYFVYWSSPVTSLKATAM